MNEASRQTETHPEPHAEHPELATADELARVYLRGRDVPCPGCRRNRREQAVAECPFCGLEIHVGASDPVARRAAQRATGWLVAIGLAVGLFALLYFTVILLLLTGMKVDLSRPEAVMVYTYALPASLLCTLGGLWVWFGCWKPSRTRALTRRHVSHLGWAAFVLGTGLLGLVTLDLVKIIVRAVT